MTSLIEQIRGRRVIASVSGGKDSAALSLWLTENGIEHERVFADTGWEAPETYHYLREVLPAFIGPITEVRGDRSMQEVILWKGMFPSRQRRFCTEELKTFILADHMQSRAGVVRNCTQCGAPNDDPTDDECACGGDFRHVEVINAIGIRAEESAERAKMTEWEWQDAFDCYVWRPLLDVTLDGVIAIHKRHGCPPQPAIYPWAHAGGLLPMHQLDQGRDSACRAELAGAHRRTAGP